MQPIIRFKRSRSPFTRMGVAMSRRVFGNSVGLKNNVVGLTRQVVCRGVTFRSQGESPRFAGAIRHLHEHGFASLSKLIETPALERVTARYHEVIEDERYSRVRNSESVGGVFSRMVDEKGLPELALLVNDGVGEFVRGFFGSHFRITRVIAFRNYHVPDEVCARHEVFSNNWHCDYVETDILAMFVNLGAVTEEDGPFHVVSRIRTRELLGMDADRRDEANALANDPAHVARATGPAGAVMFCNPSLCLHRAGVPQPGRYRDLAVVHFFPSVAPLAQDWPSRLRQAA